MFKLEEKITDPLSDSIGQVIRKVRAIPNWTKEKHNLRKELIETLENNHYIGIHGNSSKYNLSVVGESCLYQVPENRRGQLKVFRGKRIRLACVWSGKYDHRIYMAGEYR